MPIGLPPLNNVVSSLVFFFSSFLFAAAQICVLAHEAGGVEVSPNITALTTLHFLLFTSPFPNHITTSSKIF